jgi:inner membrane protein
VAGVFCSVIPDLDAIGFRFGIHHGDFWGHRGFTHSLVFAALLTGVVTVIAVDWLDDAEQSNVGSAMHEFRQLVEGTQQAALR